LGKTRMKLASNRSLAGDSDLDARCLTAVRFPISATVRYSFASVSSIAAVLAAGFAGSFLPYLLWWSKTGHFVYIADKDNQYYLQLASRLYYGNLFSLRDPLLPHGVTMYQSLQFVPAVLLARILGLPALEVNAVWHLWAAIALPLTFYFVFFQWLRRPWATALCAIVMLFDCGALAVEPFFIQFVRLYQAAVGHLPVQYDGQDLLTQWRIVDPAVGTPLLLFQVFSVSSVVERPKDRRLLVAAGISTALLFYTWFYFWTAAVGALSIALTVDRSARRTYAKILWIGVIAGLPAIVEGLIVKPLFNAEALHRIGFFAPVPPLSFFLLPKVALLALLVTGISIWLKPNRQGLYLWCLALAALTLSNNHIVLGMDLRAGHWRYVWGTSLSILVLLMVVQFSLNRFRASPRALVIFASAALFIEISAGTTLRAIEVDRSLSATFILNGYQKFVSWAPWRVPQLLSVNAVIAGDEEFCDLASTVSEVRPLAGYAAFLSLGIDDREWESREALNAYLGGFSEQDFRSKASAMGKSYGWGQSADPQIGATVEAGMMREFARMKGDPRPGIKAFGVRYVALQTARPDPDYLKRGWTLLEAGPYWRLWRKD
jgi:hypothetical protein